MHAHYALALTAALVLAACDSKDDTGEVTTGGPDQAGNVETLTPLEGAWYSENEIVVEDTCGYSEDSDDSKKKNSPITLTLIDASTFTLVDELDPESLNMTCALDVISGSFDCGVVSEVSDFTKENVDAVLYFEQALMGTMMSSTAGNISMTMDWSCEGKDCEMFTDENTSLPCSFEMNADAYHGG